MLTRGYPKKAGLKLVGDRHSLRDRQRKAVQRCAASDQTCRHRRATERKAGSLDGEVLLVDGYNVLLTLESALSGGAVLVGRDGALRDMAAMSRHYRRVETTSEALRLIAAVCTRHRCSEVVWYLDRPISNSARLKGLMDELAADNDWPWQVELVADPDRTLAGSKEIVATADSGILQTCCRWFNLPAATLEHAIPNAWIVDLRLGAPFRAERSDHPPHSRARAPDVDSTSRRPNE